MIDAESLTAAEFVAAPFIIHGSRRREDVAIAVIVDDDDTIDDTDEDFTGGDLLELLLRIDLVASISRMRSRTFAIRSCNRCFIILVFSSFDKVDGEVDRLVPPPVLPSLIGEGTETAG